MQSTPSDFWQWFGSQNSDDAVGLLIFGVIGVVLIVLITAITIHYMYKTRLNYTLKREMLDRGMTADEIVAIIGAGPPKCGPRKPAT